MAKRVVEQVGLGDPRDGARCRSILTNCVACPAKELPEEDLTEELLENFPGELLIAPGGVPSEDPCDDVQEDRCEDPA